MPVPSITPSPCVEVAPTVDEPVCKFSSRWHSGPHEAEDGTRWTTPCARCARRQIYLLKRVCVALALCLVASVVAVHWVSCNAAGLS